MAGTTWPVLTAGNKAKGSEVEAKFDWIEGSIIPMNAGSKTNAVYDLGEASYKWRDGYFSRNLYVGGAISCASIVVAGNMSCATIDTGQGLVECYKMNQDVETTDAVVFATVDTGQGANELYKMNQDVETTDDVTFNSVTVPTTTLYYPIAPADFISSGYTNLLYMVADNGSYGYLEYSAGSIIAPVKLTHGTLLTQIDYYVLGGTGGTNQVISGCFFRVSRTGTSVPIGVTQSSAFTSTYQTLTDDFSNTVVDTENYFYCVVFVNTNANPVGHMRNLGARIAYQVTTP